MSTHEGEALRKSYVATLALACFCIASRAPAAPTEALLAVRGGQAKVNALACDAAKAAFLHEMGMASQDRPVVIGKLQSNFARHYRPDALRNPATAEHGGWSVAPPSLESVQALQAGRDEDPWEVCPGFAQVTAEHGVKRRAPDTRQKLRNNGDYVSIILSMSLPVVNPSGTEALMTVESIYAPEAGGQKLVLLRRSGNGAWRVVGSVLTAIS